MEGQNCHTNDLQNAQVAAIMVPLPAQGHLNQLLHLSHLLVSYGIPVYYVGSAQHNHQTKLRFRVSDPESSNKVQFHDLQLPPFSSPPPNPNAPLHFPAHIQPLLEASSNLRQPIFEFLQHLSPKFRRLITIHDLLMASAVQDAKLIPNAESYTLYPISAIDLSLNVFANITEKPFQPDFYIPKFALPIEGSVTPEFATFVDNQLKFLDFQSGRIYNTCRLLEDEYIKILERLPMNANVKHFAIGPFHPVQMKTRSEKLRHGSLEWLDKQGKGSVIYVSFGSITSISDEQTRELALGLEQSGHKFIWVLRRADKGDASAEDEESRSQLPEGYEERIKSRGLVVRDWAPQLEILAHPSTGGFMSHCGWNSCMESISMGVPIAAWPMHSDQPMNSVLVTQVLRIGTVVREWARRSELVTMHTVENAVRRLMASKEGEEIRKRAAELGEKVRASLAEGGSTHLERESFIAHITR